MAVQIQKNNDGSQYPTCELQIPSNLKKPMDQKLLVKGEKMTRRKKIVLTWTKTMKNIKKMNHNETRNHTLI